jgi:hypothetical protein
MRGTRGAQRLVLLFALVAAVFAMHALDAGHDLNSAGPMPAMTATHAVPMAGMDAEPMAQPVRSTDSGGHEHHAGAACLALLASVLGFAGLLTWRQIGAVSSRLRSAGAVARAWWRTACAAAFDPPDPAALGISRT